MIFYKDRLPVRVLGGWEDIVRVQVLESGAIWPIKREELTATNGEGEIERAIATANHILGGTIQ